MNTHKRHCTQLSTRPDKQTGAALIIGLVLLVALTIIGVSSLTTTSLEHRMAGNMGDVNQAFNATETASRAMQRIIAPLSIPPKAAADCIGTASNVAPLCIVNTQANSWWLGTNHAWWTTNAIELAGTGTISSSNVKTQPHIIVEKLQFVPDSLVRGLDYVTKGTQYYRITSRGTGRSNSSQAMVQQTIAKRYN